MPEQNHGASRATDIGKRRRWGIALLVSAIAAGLLGLGSFYAHATHTHVSVIFSQRGLDDGGARIQIEVNCSGVYGSATAPEEETVDLGWLRRSDVVTVQATAGAESYYLHVYVNVNGQKKSVFDIGQPENPVGIGGHTTLVGESILNRSFQADGRELINTGCSPTTHPSLALDGKPTPPKTWHELPNLTFYATTYAWTVLSWMLYLIGGGVATFAVAQHVFTGGNTRTLRRAVFAALAAVVGTSLTILGLVEYLDGLRYAKDAVAGLTAFAFGVAGVWLLRHEVAHAATRFDSIWTKE